MGQFLSRGTPGPEPVAPMGARSHSSPWVLGAVGGVLGPTLFFLGSAELHFHGRRVSLPHRAPQSPTQGPEARRRRRRSGGGAVGCSLPPALHPRSHLAPVTSSWSSRTAGAEVGADGGARGGRRARGAGAGRAPRFLCAWWAGCLVSRQGFGPCHCSRAPWAHFLFCLWWVCGTRPGAAPWPARCRVRLWMGLVTAVPSGPAWRWERCFWVTLSRVRTGCGTVGTVTTAWPPRALVRGGGSAPQSSLSPHHRGRLHPASLLAALPAPSDAQLLSHRCLPPPLGAYYRLLRPMCRLTPHQ